MTNQTASDNITNYNNRMDALIDILGAESANPIWAIITDSQKIKLEQLIAQAYQRGRADGQTVAGKKVEFQHTAVNGDMHLFIDGFHNPEVCPECIQPGLLQPPTKEAKG